VVTDDQLLEHARPHANCDAAAHGNVPSDVDAWGKRRKVSDLRVMPDRDSSVDEDVRPQDDAGRDDRPCTDKHAFARSCHA